MENLHTPDCIRTYTGTYVNVFEPTTEMINITDICHGLAHQCRFGGHTTEFYSVAQHSVMASRMFNDWKSGLDALLHDAAEAYLLDIPSPIKAHLPGYRNMENRLMQIIAQVYNTRWPLTDAVKKADKELLEYEWNHMVLRSRGKLINYWSPSYAKAEFMQRYRELTEMAQKEERERIK